LGCRLVLLACNTASAVALRRLQQTWLPGAFPAHRVLGVVVPTVEAITKVPWHVRAPLPKPAHDARLAAVFATRRSVESEAYPYEIAQRAPSITVVQKACPGLVERIENDASEQEIVAMVGGFVAALLDDLGGPFPDAAVLGCTHYSLVARHFAAALPGGVQILDQPVVVAESLQRYLARHPAFDRPDPAGGEIDFFTTGAPERIDPLASRFFGREVHFHRLPRGTAR